MLSFLVSRKSALDNFVIDSRAENSAHAGNAPWEGANALDAAFLAYSNISVLRQQIKPDHRVTGIVQGCKGGANGKSSHIRVDGHDRHNMIY